MITTRERNAQRQTARAARTGVRRGFALCGALGSALGITAVLGFGCASPREPADPLLAREIFHLAGVEGSVRAVTEALVVSANGQAASLPGEQSRELIERVGFAAAPDTMIAEAQRLFAERSVGSVFLEPTAEFLTSPLGRCMRILEDRFDREFDEADLSRFVDALFSAPVPIDRIHLLERLAAATRSAPIAADIEAIAARVVARAAARVESSSGPGEVPEAAFDAIERRRARTEAALRAQSTVLMQYAYRDATDEELADYAAFAESPAGIWLADTTQRTLGELEPWLDARMAARPVGAVREAGRPDDPAPHPR